MGDSGSWTHEVESSVEASKLFKAAFTDWPLLAPSLMPDFISSFVIEGDGGVGTTWQINFSSSLGAGTANYVKERLDLVDMNSLEYKKTLIGGGHLGIMLETGSMDFKFVPKELGGGSVCKIVATYKLIPGFDKENVSAGVEPAKEMLTASIKAAEAYILANPEYS